MIDAFYDEQSMGIIFINFRDPSAGQNAVVDIVYHH